MGDITAYLGNDENKINLQRGETDNVGKETTLRINTCSISGLLKTGKINIPQEKWVTFQLAYLWAWAHLGTLLRPCHHCRSHTGQRFFLSIHFLGAVPQLPRLHESSGFEPSSRGLGRH